MVDENVDELIVDGFVYECCSNGWVDIVWEIIDYFFVADLGADAFYLFGDDVVWVLVVGDIGSFV